MTQSLLPVARKIGLATGVLAASATVTACGMSQITSGIGGGLFGASETTATVPPTVTEADLLSSAQLGDGGSAVAGSGLPAMSCPKIDVWDRDKHVTVYEDGQAGDGLAVIHRGEITKTARECEIRPGEIIVKYGFSGRVLLGPRGVAGPITLPVHVHVTDPSRDRIQTDQMSVAVDIPADKPIGYFSMVRVVTIPVVEGTRPADYKLYVAFDRGVPAG